jgi:hypothetical protein
LLRPASAIGATALLGTCLVFSIVSLGIQKSFQLRARQDRAEMAQLRDLWPDPPSGAVFVPVRIERPPHRSGGSRLDDMMWPALATWWSARWIVQLSYGRSDIDAGYTTWPECAILDADERSASIRGVGRRPWDLIIPFQVDSRGMVAPVSRIRLILANGSRLEVEPRLARAGAHAAGVTGITLDMEAK